MFVFYTMVLLLLWETKILCEPFYSIIMRGVILSSSSPGHAKINQSFKYKIPSPSPTLPTCCQVYKLVWMLMHQIHKTVISHFPSMQFVFHNRVMVGQTFFVALVYGFFVCFNVEVGMVWPGTVPRGVVLRHRMLRFC